MTSSRPANLYSANNRRVPRPDLFSLPSPEDPFVYYSSFLASLSSDRSDELNRSRSQFVIKVGLVLSEHVPTLFGTTYRNDTII
jgi:hypothetical protein